MKTNIMSRLNQMARIIREKKAVPMGELCMQMNLAPSTIYQYARLMKNVFLDITFENSVFSTTWDEKLEELSSQKTLTSRSVCV
jgi:predicted DNA-binding transcriptional regulator YafY